MCVHFLYKFMSYCLQSKLFHLFVFITSESRSMPRVAWGACPRFHFPPGYQAFSTAFAFNGRRLFGDFPHLNSGRDLQIFDAHIFRCCFAFIDWRRACFMGPLPFRSCPPPPPVVVSVIAFVFAFSLSPTLVSVGFTAAVERNAVMHWKGFRGI